MANVTYDHVTKRFGDVVAVNDLDIQIADKEFLVLVGPSGCGKSTALRCLAGLEEVTAGTILIGDRVVNDVAPKDRDIAMVFQSYACCWSANRGNCPVDSGSGWRWGGPS
jgi:multiple sugar transport system ATP-binding protein